MFSDCRLNNRGGEGALKEISSKRDYKVILYTTDILSELCVNFHSYLVNAIILYLRKIYIIYNN